MKETLIALGASAAIGIIGYLLVRFINHTDKLAESINKLNISITGINGVLLSMKENSDKVDETLKCHADKLEDHGERIAVLEVLKK